MLPLPYKLYSVQQVRAMDQMAINKHAISGISLMRKAGSIVFEFIQRQYALQNLVIFCGGGNNAGDGYVIAKLAKESGVSVVVYYLSDPESLTGDAATAFLEYKDVKGCSFPFNKKLVLTECVVVDALLGTGMDRHVCGQYAKAIDLINLSGESVVSVDVPSGLNAETGMVMGYAIKATHTLSFIALKQGMFTGDAANYCGEIIHSDLDFPAIIFKSFISTVRIINQPVFPKRQRAAHKGHYGHVLLIGGTLGFSGAIKLASEAALRIGAGLVSVATDINHALIINTTRPEIMCHGVINSTALLPLLNKASLVVIGPGLGQSSWAKDLFNCVINSDKPLIVDADALNLLAKDHQQRDNWVLTPHPGEAARLLGCSTPDISKNRFAAVSKIQKIYGGVVVLKGAGTLITNGNDIRVSRTGNPGMAGGGMGDVLTGMIAGLVAQKWRLDQAAVDAVYLHGEAADLCAEAEGERGLLASDLMPLIRKLINR